jgi:hypothetical protein
MDPAELSRELGLEAIHSFRAGEPRPSRNRFTSPSVHGESYWLGSLDPASLPAANWFSGFSRLAQKQIDKAVIRSLGWALLLTGPPEPAEC